MPTKNEICYNYYLLYIIDTNKINFLKKIDQKKVSKLIKFNTQKYFSTLSNEEFLSKIF